MLLIQVRISRLGRHGFFCRRELALLFEDSSFCPCTASLFEDPMVVGDSLMVSGKSRGFLRFFPSQGPLECISRTSFSTYSRFVKQAGKLRMGIGVGRGAAHGQQTGILRFFPTLLMHAPSRFFLTGHDSTTVHGHHRYARRLGMLRLQTLLGMGRSLLLQVFAQFLPDHAAEVHDLGNANGHFSPASTASFSLCRRTCAPHWPKRSCPRPQDCSFAGRAPRRDAEGKKSRRQAGQ